jgi:predicted transcriptional regulator
MKVLMSIKPEFASKIFDGTKKFEFRRSIFKDTTVKKIIVYASHPIQKVIGEFEIDGILTLDIEKLWQQTHQNSGISKQYFLKYFVDKEHGYAIKIKNTRRYKKPLCIKGDFNTTAPQSFRYVA